MKKGVCTLAAILVAANLCACTDVQVAESTEVSTSVLEAGLASATEDQAGTEAVEEPSATDAVGFNDTLHAQNFDFSILSAELCDSVTNQLGMTYEAESGTQFLLVTFSAVNTAHDEMNVMNVDFNSYIDDKKVAIQSIVGEIDGFMPLSGAVAAGKTFEGYAVWEVPDGWNTLEFSYIDALTGVDSDIMTIYATDVS